MKVVLLSILLLISGPLFAKYFICDIGQSNFFKTNPQMKFSSNAKEYPYVKMITTKESVYAVLEDEKITLVSSKDHHANIDFEMINKNGNKIKIEFSFSISNIFVIGPFSVRIKVSHYNNLGQLLSYAQAENNINKIAFVSFSTISDGPIFIDCRNLEDLENLLDIEQIDRSFRHRLKKNR